jgi:HlyD family secretion protein
MRAWIIAIVGVVVVGGAVAWMLFPTAAGQFDVATASVVAGPIRMTIETSGTVEPLSTVQVGCEVTGKIIELTANDDEPVQKGQVLARIDPQLAEAEHLQSEADYIKAQSVLASTRSALEEQIANLPVLTKQALAKKQEAEAALTEAEQQWKRVERIHGVDAASDQEYIVTKAVWQRAQAGLTAAEAAHEMARNNETFVLDQARQAVAQAEATLKLAEARRKFTAAQMERCTVVSPIDGIVLKRYLDVGTTVVAAFQSPLLYLLSPSLDRIKVSAKVSESDIAHIEVGQPVRFTVEAREPVEFRGRIMHKHNQPEIVQNVVTYTVVFEVDNDARRTLIPGLSVNVEIECVSKANVPQVPNAVLRFKPPLPLEERRALVEAASWPDKPTADPDGQAVAYCNKAYVWQFDAAQKTWHVVPLWVGVTDNVSTEILAGAKPGDTFVKKFEAQGQEGFGFKDALKLASPSNRRL